jgi:hypothetical protein
MYLTKQNLGAVQYVAKIKSLRRCNMSQGKKITSRSNDMLRQKETTPYAHERE